MITGCASLRPLSPRKAEIRRDLAAPMSALGHKQKFWFLNNHHFCTQMLAGGSRPLHQKQTYFCSTTLGRRLIIPQPDANGRELDHGHVVRRQLVVAGGDTTKVFDLIEEPLDEVARLVESGAEANRILAV